MRVSITGSEKKSAGITLLLAGERVVNLSLSSPRKNSVSPSTDVEISRQRPSCILFDLAILELRRNTPFAA